jgi:hypothetical protein
LFTSRKVFDVVMALNPRADSLYTAQSVPDDMPPAYVTAMFKDDVLNQLRLAPVVSLLGGFYIDADIELTKTDHLPPSKRKRFYRRFYRDHIRRTPKATTPYLILLEEFLSGMQKMTKDSALTNYNPLFHSLLEAPLKDASDDRKCEWKEEVDSLRESLTVYDDRYSDNIVKRYGYWTLFSSVTSVMSLIVASTHVSNSSSLGGDNENEEEQWLAAIEPYRKLIASLKAMNTKESRITLATAHYLE